MKKTLRIGEAYDNLNALYLRYRNLRMARAHAWEDQEIRKSLSRELREIEQSVLELHAAINDAKTQL